MSDYSNNLPPQNGEENHVAEAAPIGRFQKFISKLGAGALSGDMKNGVGVFDPLAMYPSELDLKNRLLYSSSEILSDRPLSRSINTAILRRGDTPAADKVLTDTGLQINAIAEQQGFHNVTPTEKFLNFANFAFEIDRKKVQLTTREAPTDRSNALIANFGDELVKQVAREDLSEHVGVLNAIITRITAFESTDGADPRWLIPKLRTLLDSLNLRIGLYDYAESLPGTRKNVSLEQMAQDDTEVKILMNDVIKNRREYGVKLSYIPAGLGGSLVFDDHSSVVNIAGPSKNVHLNNAGYRDIVAVIYPSGKDDFETLSKGKVIRDVYNKDASLISNDISEYDAKSMFRLDKSGELFLDSRRHLSVKSAFAEIGLYETYRKLQGEIIANFFDLTTADFVSETIGTNDGPVTARSIHKMDGDPIDVMYDMVLPRLKRLEHSPKVKQAEVASDNIFRLHDVTWHRRNLPNGWKASPAARELANKLGVLLEPNQTFVRAHERGDKSKGVVTSHRIKSRKNK